MSRDTRKLAWAAIAFACTTVLALFYRRYVWLGPETWNWDAFGIHFVIRSPRLLGLVLLAPSFLVVLSRSLADLPWQQQWASLFLRTAFLACLALSLARLARIERTQKVATVFLADVSDSMTDDAIADAREWLGHLLAARPEGDIVRAVTFARRPLLVTMEETSKVAPALARHTTSLGKDAGAGTDIQAALQLAYGLYPPGYLRRAVVYSDGLETSGDLLSESNRARALGIKLFVVPSRRPVPAEVAVQRLIVPDQVKVGEPFEVTAEIYASRAATAKAQLYQGDTLNGLDSLKELDLKPGLSEISWRSVVRMAGEISYLVELHPHSPDQFEANNRYMTTVDVPGRPAVLYVEGEPARAAPLASALEKQGFDVDLRAPQSFPASLRELERYDFVILSDTPAEQVAQSSQDLVERYLRELGGGFLFAGGPNGYGPGGWTHTPIERILPVRMDSERRRDTPTIAMALVIDRSGSMTGLPLEMAKQAAKATVDTLALDDLIEVIAFDSLPARFVKIQPARNRSKIETDIARIQAGGGTEIFPALDAAYQDLSVAQARKKHVVLLTDGRAPSSGIRDLVQAMAAESITVTTVGLGPEVDDQLLSMIKDFGGGRYHKVPDPNSLPKIFTREAEIVAKSAASVDYFPVRQVGPADFLRGIDIGTTPLLGGYTATRMKGSPAQEILQHGDQDDPILARWRVGLGFALAWTSDVKARWAAEWTKWPGWTTFWGQLVHEHMRQRRRNELEMRTEVVAGQAHAVVDAFSAEDRFDNGLESVLSVVGPLGSRTGARDAQRSIPMIQTAPGRYEAQFPLDQYGSYLLRAQHRRRTPDGQATVVATSSGHVSLPYPPEYERLDPDLTKLERAATATEARMDPPETDVFDPAGEHVSMDQELWPRGVGAAIVLLLLDLLMRRVRLFDRKFAARATR